MCPTPIYNYHSSFKYIQFTTKYMLILYDHLLLVVKLAIKFP